MTKYFIYAVIALALLIGACQVNNGPIAGTINGRSISYSEYMDAFRTEYENFYTLERRAPNPEEKKEIGRVTWLFKTKHAILEDYYKKYDIGVTHQEVIDTLTQNPPAYILNSPRFRIDGKFDKESYLQSLNYDSPQNLKPVRKKYFDDIIPIQKLKDKLINNEFLTKRTTKEIAQIIGAKADIDWVVFDASNADVKMNDSFVSEYYQSHADKYMQDARLSLQYTLIHALPTQEDLKHSQAVADSIYEAAISGVSFEDLVNTETGKTNRITNTTTGFLLIPDLQGEIKTAIYGREAGDILSPMTSSEGIEIYRVDSVTRSMIKLSRLLIPHAPGLSSINNAEKKARNLIELATLIGMEKAATEMDHTLCYEENIQTEARITDDPILDKQILTATDKATQGTILAPIYSYSLSSWVVVYISEKTLKAPKPLASIKDQVRKDLMLDKKVEFVTQKAKIWLDSFDPTASLSSTDEYQVYSTKAFTMHDKLNGLDVSDIFYKAMFAHLNKEPMSFHQHGDLYLIPVIRRTTLPRNPNIDKSVIRKLYVRNLEPNWFDLWMDQQVKNAKTKYYTLGQ